MLNMIMACSDRDNQPMYVTTMSADRPKGSGNLEMGCLYCLRKGLTECVTLSKGSIYSKRSVIIEFVYIENNEFIPLRKKGGVIQNQKDGGNVGRVCPNGGDYHGSSSTNPSLPLSPWIYLDQPADLLRPSQIFLSLSPRLFGNQHTSSSTIMSLLGPLRVFLDHYGSSSIITGLCQSSHVFVDDYESFSFLSRLLQSSCVFLGPSRIFFDDHASFSNIMRLRR
eukprot:TRINITY_DN140_c0_g1_i12.p1 TRINITY_DN140_c0_g1~~TRINITY_DN140_c0_g1_i12.p1  ORF type:complete len:224 (+),score=27.40 TRINITY_DN140_c0_g1_i12:636-1307(+)